MPVLIRPNPYERPSATTHGALSDVATRNDNSRWLIALLIPVTVWAIYQVSPVGILIPGAIGVAVGRHCRGGIRVTAACTTLAYFVGVITISCADVLTHAYAPLILTDDTVRPQLARAWAAFGVLGSLGGALMGCLVAEWTRPEDRAESGKNRHR